MSNYFAIGEALQFIMKNVRQCLRQLISALSGRYEKLSTENALKGSQRHYRLYNFKMDVLGFYLVM